MKFVELKSSLNNVKNAYFILGKDSYLRNSAQKLIENACVKSLPDFNINSFDNENFDITKILDICQSMPLCDNRRVVIIKNITLDKTSVDMILKYLQKQNNYCCLLFVKEELSTNEKPLLNFCETVDCNYLDEKIIEKIIAKKLQEKLIKSDIYTIKCLISYCNYNLSKINLELEKLIAYVGEGGILEKNHIELMVVKDVEYSIFELSNAVLEKNGEVAFKVLTYMIENGESIQNMFGLLLSSFRRLFFARTSNLSNTELAKHLEVKEYAIKLARNKKLSATKLKEILELGSKLDFQIRKGEITDKNAIYTFISNSILI